MHWAQKIFSHTVYAFALLAAAAPADWAARIDSNLDPALVDALYRGDSAAAILSLERGANPNARSAEGVPALTLAVLHADRRAVSKLIERGADVNARSGQCWTCCTAGFSLRGASAPLYISGTLAGSGPRDRNATIASAIMTTPVAHTPLHPQCDQLHVPSADPTDPPLK